MGVRWVVSTYAFLSGKPKDLVSIDINFEFKLSNTLELDIKPTDLLFIDTWHAYKQLKAELAHHHTKVRKYIVLHDTTTYGYKDETSYEHWGDDWKGDGIGLWPAVLEFLEDNPEWVIKKRYLNNNGLTVLMKNK